uniref:Uncharacterized protein n=1 Tax=Globodera rostochiensis TaxID=31243 RepID=A0A914H694_GLORO
MVHDLSAKLPIHRQLHCQPLEKQCLACKVRGHLPKLRSTSRGGHGGTDDQVEFWYLVCHDNLLFDLQVSAIHDNEALALLCLRPAHNFVICVCVSLTASSLGAAPACLPFS